MVDVDIWLCMAALYDSQSVIKYNIRHYTAAHTGGTQQHQRLSWCWDSRRYDKICDNGTSANPNRDPE